MFWALWIALSSRAEAADGLWTEVSGQYSPQATVTGGLGLGYHADRLFTHLKLRGTEQGPFIGRLTLGADLLGKSEHVDLDVGLFAGAIGDWRAGLEQTDPTGGFSLSLQIHAGPVHIGLEHADGFRNMLVERVFEDEVHLGLRMVDLVELFALYSRFPDADSASVHSVGGGVKLVF